MVRPSRSSRLFAGLGAFALVAVTLGGAPAPGTVPPWFPSGPPAPEFLATLPADVHVDNFGNAWVTRGSGRPHVLVLAHRDVPGWVVSQVTADGYLRLQRLGNGASPLIDQFLVGRRLVVYTRRGPLPAVTVAPSTHFRRGANVPVPEATTEDLWVDIGAENADDVAAMGVRLLDPVVPLTQTRGAIPHAPVDVVTGLARGFAPPAGRTVTYAWVADGTEGGRGSRRLLDTLGPVDSVIVIEAMALADNDSTARALAFSDASLGVAPADSAHGPSRAWAEALRAANPRLSAAPLRPASGDARAWSAAGVPSVVLAVGAVYAGSPGAYVPTDGTAGVAALLGLHPGIVAPAQGVPAVALPATGWDASPATDARPLRSAWTTIASLLAPYGVSEHETQVAKAVLAQLPPDAARAARIDERGNVILPLGDGAPARLFVAHMDEIGYRTHGADPNGRARVVREGGFYDWLYEGERVHLAMPDGGGAVSVVVPRDGERQSARPTVLHPLADEVHASPGAASRFDVTDVRVDTWSPWGAPLRDGTDVTVLHEMARLGEHRFTARAIDDRFGDAALVMAARELWPERHHLPNAVWLVWSVEEEIGLKGAQWLADSLAHHGALPIRVHAVDTFVSSDSPLESPRIGGARLGRGAVIRAIDTSHEAPLPAVDATLRLARANDIPLQFGVTAGGNDGVPFAEHGSINVPLGWPLRSSHSAVEVADLRDLESLAKLVRVLAEQPARDDPSRP